MQFTHLTKDVLIKYLYFTAQPLVMKRQCTFAMLVGLVELAKSQTVTN